MPSYHHWSPTPLDLEKSGKGQYYTNGGSHHGKAIVDDARIGYDRLNSLCVSPLSRAATRGRVDTLAMPRHWKICVPAVLPRGC
jgi:hypothetical protein